MKEQRRSSKVIRLGVDTGGTFTDFIVVIDGAVSSFKVPSTPLNPAQAIISGIRAVMAENNLVKPEFEIVHGTTVGTNALLERKGARTALVTTAGFEDVIEIGRQSRPDLYNLNATRPEPLVPRELRLSVKERIGPDGAVVEPLSSRTLPALRRKLIHEKVESVALSLLFSFVNPIHEQIVADALSGLGIPVTVSHQLIPEYREYERTSTVVLNAYLAPKVGTYLNRLVSGIAEIDAQPAGAPSKQNTAGTRSRSSLRIMQSSGGAISAETAGREPVRTILSGPAGGLIAAGHLGALTRSPDIITFDMGGTSTDVALCRGAAKTTNEAKVTGLPVSVPVLDIHTVGAGGGSIAYVDSGGALRVGPESAGADPGPACYGKGALPTVTDANVVLGRFGPGGLLSGKIPLDRMRAHRAIADLASQIRLRTGQQLSEDEAAEGVIRVANANMERALRLVSIERGQDPRRYAMISFGGAGGLHAAALADALRIPKVIVPIFPGAFSALGLLLADVTRDYSRTIMIGIRNQNPGSAFEIRLRREFRNLERIAGRELREEGFRGARVTMEPALSVRYEGQSFELDIPFAGNLASVITGFHSMHKERYGHSNPGAAIEIVSARLRAIGITDKPEIPRMHRGGRQMTKPVARHEIYLAGKIVKVPVFDRLQLSKGQRVAGPAIITEYGSTTLLPGSWKLEVDGWGNLIMKPHAQPAIIP